MKRLILFVMALLVGSLVVYGSGTEAQAAAKVSGDIAVLNLGADTSSLTKDQVALLQKTLTWMDRDLQKGLKKSGLKPTQINAEKEYTGGANSYLLKLTITEHKMIPKGARFLGGMMAGTDRLNVHYELVDSTGKSVLTWDDVQGSTRGGTYCAQTLNRNAVKKIVEHLSAG